MKDLNVQPESQQSVGQTPSLVPAHENKPLWETPKLEDVSEQVMAQPYIRFT
ncbi:MAG TPA: hypothetical protein VGL25_18340 [Casimicrobiaceae bacterium]